MNKKKTIKIPLYSIIISIILLVVIIRIFVSVAFAKSDKNKVDANLIENNIGLSNASEPNNVIDYLPSFENDIIENDVEENIIEEPEEEPIQEETQQEEQPQETQETQQQSTTPVKKSPTVKRTKKGTKYYLIGRIIIPKININYSIISECTNELMNYGITKFWGSDPNEVGNMVLVAHNYRNDGKYFSRLHYVTEGDTIQIKDLYDRTFTYKVYQTMIIDPNDTTCTSQLTNGNIECTLITCYNKGTQRYAVKARLE